MHLRRLLMVSTFLLILLACKDKKKQLSEDDIVDYAEFLGLFQEVKLPFQSADTALLAKDNDSLRIPYKIYTQFISDTTLKPLFGKVARPKIYPVGKAVVKDGETYLLVKAVAAPKRALLIAVFDQDSFVTAMPVLITGGANKTGDHSLVNMDSRYTITTLQQKTASNGQSVYAKKVYVYNTAGVFTLILTESNDQENHPVAILNPIDTLGTVHKLTGDYVQDKKNILSFRDGRKTNSLLFFAHFEKDGGACKGELKGEAQILSSKTARFTENNGTCSIDFTFNGNMVTMKEVGGCGSYRDIKCFFEGSYIRKKKPVQKTVRKKK